MLITAIGRMARSGFGIAQYLIPSCLDRRDAQMGKRVKAHATPNTIDRDGVKGIIPSRVAARILCDLICVVQNQ
jgi:hypothetical protein